MNTAAIIVVGDEVLSGEVRDENGPYLIARLTALGTRVVRLSIVPDLLDAIASEVRASRAAADTVLVTGGIGPTHDDLTRQAVALALGVPLSRHAEAAEKVARWYGASANDAERAMADLPTGSLLLRGRKSDTLGFHTAGVYVFPGVPFLLRDLVEGSSDAFVGPPLHREEVRTDLREGEVAPDLARIQSAAPDVAIGSYPIPDDGTWWTKIVVRGVDAARVTAVAAEVRAAFERLTGA